MYISSIKAGLYLIFICLCLNVVAPFLGVLWLLDYLHVYANSLGGWSIDSEGANESKYTYSVKEFGSAIKLVLYMNSSGDINKDWIKLIVYGSIITIEGNTTSYENYIAGCVKIGYEGDRKGTTRGLHVIYYLLPKVTYVNFIELILHSDGGHPKLYIGKSWVEVLNMTSTYWIHEDGLNSQGIYVSGLTSWDAGELKVAVFSQNYQKSQLSVYYGRAFKPEMGGTADIYVDVGYMGGFNIAPMSSYGTGKYTVKLDVGVKQSNNIEEVLRAQDFETILYMKGGGGWIEMPVGFAADRVEDILLDLIVDYGLEFIKSPMGRAFFKFIPYISQIIEWLDLFSSLQYDDLVNGSKRLVFSNIHMDPRSNNIVYVWTHFVGETESYMFSANLVNFYGDPPWQSILEKYFGVDVWRLNYGGIYVGGVALDYFNVPDIASELPQGGERPATTEILVKFDKPIDRSSLPPFDNSIKIWVGGDERPFLEHFRYELDRNNTSLRIYPNYRLDYGSIYVIEFTQGIRGVDGTNLVKSYSMWFTTERKQQVGRVLYYVLPSAVTSAYHKGKVFEAYYCDNVSVIGVGLNKATIRFMESGVNVEAEYFGEGLFYTNDVDIDYYDGGFGRLYIANNTVWFVPFSAKDYGTPPHSGSLIFSLGSTAIILNPKHAKVIISWLSVGNPEIKKALRDAGIVEGAELYLEPVPVMDYSKVSSIKVGEGEIVSVTEPWLNGTHLPLYLLTTIDRQIHDLGKVLGNYSSLYKGLGGMPVDWDVFLFTISNITHMRAWRLTPPGYAQFVEQPKINTYTIRFPDLPAEITLLANTTIKLVNTSYTNQEIQVVVEGEYGSSGYLIVMIPEQLGIVAKSATVDGKPVEVEALNQTMFSGVNGVRLTYRFAQSNSTIIITVSPPISSVTQTSTNFTAEGRAQTYPMLLTIAAVIAVVAVVAVVLIKVTIRRP
ncbi:MAG: Ig-like domain-containing protein [Sulfolobales archaeon]